MEKQYVPDMELEYELLRQVQVGDREALKALALGYLWFIVKLARTYTPEDDEGDTTILYMVSDVFIKTAKSIEITNPTVCFLEEVYQNVRIRFGDMQRDSIHHVHRLLSWVHSIDTISLQLPTHGGDAQLQDMVATPHVPRSDQQIWEDQLRLLVPEMLQVLPEKEQRVVTLHFLYDMEVSEVANVMKISGEKVRGLLKKALRQLKRTVPQNQFDFVDK